MAKKRKLTSLPPAKAPAVEVKEEAAEEEPSHVPTEESSHEEEEPSVDEPDQQIDENSQPNVPPAELGGDGDSDGDGDGGTDVGNDADGDEAGGGEDDDENVEKDPDSIQKLLDPFPKDHLIELLRDAAVKHPDVMAEIHRVADLDPVHRKIFVHGLGWDTNAQTLTAAFRQYGEIEDCNAVMDKGTGKSKGYGFILFKHRIGARRALKEPQKKIGNRMTACQLASAGPVPPPAPPVSEYTQRKIFVSNVGAELDPQKLLQFFSKFGEIEEGPLGLDKLTGKPKGFALFVYKSVESAKRALEEPHKNYEGHILHCQKAIDGPKPNKLGFQFQGSGAHHGLHQAAGGMLGSHFSRNDTGLLGGVGSHLSSASGAGHLMAPSATGLGGFNQAAQPAAVAAATGLNPALGQALTAFLATQGAGLSLGNVLGNLGSGGMAGAMMNQGGTGNSSGHSLHSGYGGGVGGSMNAGMMGGYGSHMQGGYGNSSTGQGGAGRSQTGHGQMGGLGHYMGR